MIERQRGIILITVLLFTFILTLLITSSMNTALLESKFSQNYHAHQLGFEAAEAGLKQAEQDILNNNKTYPTLNAVLSIRKSWWFQQTPGSFPEASVFYVIEQWPMTKCIQMHAETFKVIYYRIGSYGVSGNIATLLQGNYAKAINSDCKAAEPNTSQLGRLSWQQLK